MPELIPQRVKYFIDKSSEDLAQTLAGQDTETLRNFFIDLKDTLIKYPTSPSLLKLQDNIADELVKRMPKTITHDYEPAVAEKLPYLSSITWETLEKRQYPEEQWIIDKIVPQAGITMFVGEAAAGKSFIALDAVKAIITGSKFLDNFEVKTPCEVLIIDKENGMRRLQKRLKGLAVAGTDKIHFLEYPEQFDLENEEFTNYVSELIKQHNIGLVILDSFIDILLGSENDAGDTNKVFNLLRSISTTVNWFILHHDSKPIPATQRTAGQKTRGSSNIIAQVDNQFYIEKTKNPLIINIEQGKSRDNEPVKKFSIEFLNENSQMSGFRFIGEVQDEVSKVNTAVDFVVEYLTSNTNCARQYLVDAGSAGGISARSIDRAIKMLKEKSIIDFVKSGNKNLFFLTDDNKLDDELLANGEQLANITD